MAKDCVDTGPVLKAISVCMWSFKCVLANCNAHNHSSLTRKPLPSDVITKAEVTDLENSKVGSGRQMGATDSG